MTNRFSVALLLGGWCLSAGCAQQAPPASPPASNSVTGAPQAAKVDLSVPRLPPKPLIWVEDWKGEPEASQERVNAEAVVQMADGMKAGQEYSNAARGYRTAIRTDPTWA